MKSNEYNVYADLVERLEEEQPEGFNAADPKQVNAAKREAGAEESSDREVMKQLTDYRPGRAFLWRLFEKCHMFETSFFPDSARLTDFREGERNIGLRLFEQLGQANPTAYTQMLREHREKHY